MSANFQVYSPPVEPKFTITGPNCQILTIAVEPGEVIQAEPGSMMVMSDFMSSSMKCTGCGTCLTGEGCCLSTYTNNSENRDKGFIALTPNYPAKIVPVDLSKLGGSLITLAGSYMASFNDVNIESNCDVGFNCCCGGLGMVRQELKGKGWAFLNAGGTILQRELAANEKIIVDSSSVVAFGNTVKMELKRTGGCCQMCCGGEGFFNTEFTGPGPVYIQSMSFSKYKLAVAPIVLQPGQL